MSDEPIRAPGLPGRVALFDERVDAAVLRLPRSLRPAMWLATTVGYPAVQAGVLVVLAVATTGAVRVAFALAAASLALPRVVKHLVGRRRPESEYVAAMRMAGPSFPSGHAYAAVVVAGLYAYLAATWLDRAPAVLVVLAALGWIAWVSVSRLFFRAHYASDVVGGWVLGAVVLTVVVVGVQP